MDGQAWGREQLLVANMTFEVLRFLMKDQNFVIVKLSVTVPERTANKITYFCCCYEQWLATAVKHTHTHTHTSRRIWRVC